jgi:hypothetical protein
MKPVIVLDYGAKDAKWDKVRKSLDVINIDANTVTVANWDPTGKARVPLRVMLEWLAQKYRDKVQRGQTLTEREFINETTNVAQKIATARDLFAPHWLLGFTIGQERAAEIHCQLTAIETELQEKVQSILGGAYGEMFRHGQQGNASKPALCDYLHWLEALWYELAGKAGEMRHRHRFVRVCADAAGVTIKKRNGGRRSIATADVSYHLSSKKKKTAI